MKKYILDIVIGTIMIFAGLSFSNGVFATCSSPDYCQLNTDFSDCKMKSEGGGFDSDCLGKGGAFSGKCCQPKPIPAAAAAAVAAPKPVELEDPLGKTHPGIIGALSRLIGTFLGMVGALALLVFVYAGFVYMTAGGDDTRVKEAKDTMKYALVGLMLIMFAYAFASFFFTALTG